MGIDAWIVVLVILAVVGLLAFTRIAADAVLVAALGALLAVPVPINGAWRFGVITIPDALHGFANPGVATVAVLFIVVAGLRETGAIDLIAERVLGRTKGLRRTIIRLIVPVWAMSVFLNNTPVVAMMIPAAADWSKKLQCSPSKLMIPLSYAAILGGTCSLIGTSTNLVVAGLVIAETDLSLGMFDITRVGLPSAIIGALFLVIFGPRLLPDRASPSAALSDPREYSLELIVPPGSSLVDRTVEAAGLRNLPGCYLVEIERQGDIIPAVPQQVLRAGDRLLFVGVVESIRDLQNLRGLSLATDQVFKLDSPRYRRRLFEAVISPSCPLLGRTIREGRFRNRYNGVVIAVARHGERVRGKLGDIELQMGDVLLVEAAPDFVDVQRGTGDFLLVRALEHSTPRRRAQAPIALAALVGLVFLATFNIYNMMVAAMLAGGVMILTRCCTIKEARRSIDWSLLIIIGSALGIGRAMEVTGAAATIAGGVLSFAGTNPWVVLLAVYAVTSILTELITNNAAVALVFAVAHATAEQLGVNFMPFVIAIMMAGSASFATPLGYQTNTMVYGPGGYTFGDFLRIGVPMNIVMGITAVLITPLAFPFHTAP
jgi:di/tricarboxylate transporter